MSKIEIVNILNRSNFSKRFINYVKNSFPANYHMMFNRPYHKDYKENPIMDLDKEKRLMESLAQLITLELDYINKGIPLEYFYESIYDLNYRAERYYENHGSYGLADIDVRWLGIVYKAEVFDLGSLRFQVSEFSNKEIERSDYQYMPLDQKWKDKFPEGTPIITIHIMENTDFRPEKIDQALDMAREFFEKYFPEHKFEVFVCRTWLLYGPLRDILSKDSNIAAFSKKFKIIADNKNTKQALDRIYGTNDLELIKEMDKKSSLEKQAYKNLDKLGVAAGIIYR